MDKRIQLERRGRAEEEITELNLDNSRATNIEGLTDKYINLQSLSLINVGLTTLKGFPNLPNLKRLELSDNRISSGLDNLQGCPKLQYINLGGNKIKDIETLEPLKEFRELRNLDLFNCEVTNLEKYREQVFELLTDLEFLDGFDKSGGEAEDPDDPDDVDGEDDVSSDDDDEDGLDEEEDDDSEGEDDDGLEGDEDEEEEDEEDFDPEQGEDDDEEGEDGEEEEGEDEEETRGVKRKHEEEEDA